MTRTKGGHGHMLRYGFFSIIFLWSLSAAADAPSNRQAARELLAEGAKAFRLGEFDKAIESFKRSYDLNPDPIALYNLGQIYRQLKQNEKAIFFYQQYLAEAPNAPDRAKINLRIEELKSLQAAQKELADKPPEGVQPAPPVVPVPPPTAAVANLPPPPEADLDSGRPLYPWLVAGTGVAAAAVGVGLLASASSLDDDASHATTATQALASRDSASSRRTLGAAVTIGGGVVAAAGIAILIWNPGHHGHEEAQARQAALVAGPSWLAVRGRF